LALVLGLIAWKRARAAPGPGDARGRALAGWILGLLGVLGVRSRSSSPPSPPATSTMTAPSGVRDLEAGQCIDVPDEDQGLRAAGAGLR
jgi:hypothetical protein